MSEAKFTKGVWSVGRRGSVISTESDGITINGGTGSDADIYYGGNLICESVSDNNASLIAAAPDMYHQVVNYRHLLECIVNAAGFVNSSGLDSFKEYLEEVEAVLSKARGEHQ